MSYRDDVEALFQRAHYLQAEVDRLHAKMRGEEVESLPPMEPEIEVDIDLEVAPSIESTRPSMQGRAVWLPVVAPAPPISPADLSDAAFSVIENIARAGTPGELGVMVARLTKVEHRLMMRVLDLLTDDDFRPAAVARNMAAFDALVAELRERLAGPA